MISIVSSDLLSISADYIAHQVNCRGVMGAGLALTLRNLNPRLYSLYQQYCRQFSPHDLLGRAFVCDNIISIFGQLNYGRDRSVVYTDYSALHRAFEDKKVNMVNAKREFFRVDIDEIMSVVKQNYDKTVEYVKIPEAEQYRQSLKMYSNE
jgi:hypothetical protein